MIPRVTRTIRLMIAAGEPSGDAHAAALVRALVAMAPDVRFRLFGATGPLMRAARVESIVDADDLAIMGIFEVAQVLPKFLHAFRKLKRAAIEQAPDAVILVDWPEFNLRLARALHKLNIKVIYYVSPQLWAWRSGRVKNIRRDVDLLLAILPFEPAWYRKHGVKHVEFVGHPLAGEVKARYGREEFCRLHGLDSSRPIISLLPGSRHKEVIRILPTMLDATVLLRKQRPDLQFVLVVAPSRSLQEAREILASHAESSALVESVRVIEGETREALAASAAAAIASGTATLEASLLGTPMVIVYKESAINWHTLGRLITADHYGLVNLVAGERVVTELMQNELNGTRLAAELLSLLDAKQNQAMRTRLLDVARMLGEGGASRRAAKLVLDSVQGWE